MPTVPKGSVADVASALRSLLRFLASAEMVAADLAPLVPSCPNRRSWVPKAVPADDVTRMLASCGRDPVGLRDRAVILCLARLGLRAGEVAGMRCTDIDWVTGVVTVRGKGHRLDQLPIPVDVGAAVVDYLRRGRPPTNAGTVFLTVRAPIGGLAPSGVSHIVARAAVRAGLAPIMAHRLRHTAATESLNAGATLQEVSLLLRHANPATTMIYAVCWELHQMGDGVRFPAVAAA